MDQDKVNYRDLITEINNTYDLDFVYDKKYHDRIYIYIYNKYYYLKWLIPFFKLVSSKETETLVHYFDFTKKIDNLGQQILFKINAWEYEVKNYIYRFYFHDKNNPDTKAKLAELIEFISDKQKERKKEKKNFIESSAPESFMDVKSLFEEKSLFEILDIINDMKKYNHSQTSRQNLKLFGDENDDFINDIRKLRNDLCHNKYFLPRLTAEISKNPIFSTGNKELLEKCQNFHVDLSNRLDLFNSPNVIDKLYILIPFYSNESTIIRTLESIYNCEFKNTAKTLNYKKLLDKTYIIFCDNNSKDKTRNIIGDFYKKNKQYSTKYDIIDEPRQGIQYAREKLIKILLKECKNDNAYCCFIDADDEFNNGGLYDLVKEGLMIKDVKYDIIRGNVMQIMCGDKGKNHKEIRRYRRHEKYALVNFFARTIWNNLFRVSFLKECCKNYKAINDSSWNEEIIFWSRIAPHKPKIFISDSVTYIYHRENISSTNRSDPLDESKLNKIIELHKSAILYIKSNEFNENEKQKYTKNNYLKILIVMLASDVYHHCLHRLNNNNIELFNKSIIGINDFLIQEKVGPLLEHLKDDDFLNVFECFTKEEKEKRIKAFKQALVNEQ